MPSELRSNCSVFCFCDCTAARGTSAVICTEWSGAAGLAGSGFGASAGGLGLSRRLQRLACDRLARLRLGLLRFCCGVCGGSGLGSGVRCSRPARVCGAERAAARFRWRERAREAWSRRASVAHPAASSAQAEGDPGEGAGRDESLESESEHISFYEHLIFLRRMIAGGNSIGWADRFAAASAKLRCVRSAAVR